MEHLPPVRAHRNPTPQPCSECQITPDTYIHTCIPAPRGNCVISQAGEQIHTHVHTYMVVYVTTRNIQFYPRLCIRLSVETFFECRECMSTTYHCAPLLAVSLVVPVSVVSVDEGSCRFEGHIRFSLLFYSLTSRRARQRQNTMK